MKFQKGQYEYINYKKKSELIKTVVYFAIPLAIFFMGYISTGTKSNLLTIVAVLGCLPASKMLISFIMNSRVKCTDASVKEKIDASIGILTGLYNMYFTSYDCNYYLDHMIVTQESVIGLSLSKEFKEESFKKHLEKHLKLDGITGINIKVFNNEDAYIRRLNELNKLQSSDCNEKIIELINNISL